MRIRAKCDFQAHLISCRSFILLILVDIVCAQFFGNQQAAQNQQHQQNQNMQRAAQMPSNSNLAPYSHQAAQNQQHQQNQNIQRGGQMPSGSNFNSAPYSHQAAQNLLDPYRQRSNSQSMQANPLSIVKSNSAQTPNSEIHQHPIFNLMHDQQNQEQQTHQDQQGQAQNSFQQHHLQNQLNPSLISYKGSSQNQKSKQQNQQQQQQYQSKPRTFNRLSNQVNQWTGSGGNNSPGIFTPPTRGATQYSSGATLYIQLSSYTNERLAMKGGTTCYCPREECTLLENILHPCYFAFTIIVASSSGEPVHYISKQFVAVNNSGQPSSADGDWTVPVTLQMVSKPTYIDIFVNNLGPVIQGRQVNYLDEFWQVDTFTIDLSDYQPSIANQQPTPVSARLNGQLVSSNLEVSYYVQCQASLLGENCDLQCRPTKQQDRSVCTSRITNTNSVCGMDNNRAQVQNCQICGYGVVNDQCASLSNFNGNEVGVNKSFRVWTIILAVLLAIAILFIIILIFMYMAAGRKLRKEQQQELRNRERRFGNENNIDAYENGRHTISNPLLLSDEWCKPVHQPHAFTHHGADLDSNHNDSIPRPGVSSTLPTFQTQQPRREAQV